MSVIVRTDTNFTDLTLPILTRDTALNAGTRFLYDVLDVYTWPTQAAAASSDTLVDLADNDNATVNTGPLTWDNGLVFPIATDRRIYLPESSHLATDEAGFGVTVWLKVTDFTGTTDSILTMGVGGAGFDETQYIIYSNTGEIRMNAVGSASSIHTLAGVSADTVSTNDIVQLGLTMVKSGGDYIVSQWRDGVLFAQATITSAMVTTGAQTFAKIGRGDVFANPAGFTFFRCNANDLSTSTAQEFIEADWASRAGQFS